MKTIKRALAFIICVCILLTSVGITTVKAADTVPDLVVTKVKEFYSKGRTGFKITIKNNSDKAVTIEEFGLNQTHVYFDEDYQDYDVSYCLTDVYKLKKPVTIKANSTKTITWKAPKKYGKFEPFGVGKYSPYLSFDELYALNQEYYNTNIYIFFTSKNTKYTAMYDASKSKNLKCVNTVDGMWELSPEYLTDATIEGQSL